MTVGYLRSFFFHFCNIINDQNHNQQRYEAEQQRAGDRQHGWSGGCCSRPGVPSFSCYINLLLFPIYKSAQSSVPLFLSPDTPVRAAVLFSLFSPLRWLPWVCFPTERRRRRFYLYSPVKLWKRAPPQPAMGASSCRPHAALKAQRPTLSFHLHLHPSRFDLSTLQVLAQWGGGGGGRVGGGVRLQRRGNQTGVWSRFAPNDLISKQQSAAWTNGDKWTENRVKASWGHQTQWVSPSRSAFWHILRVNEDIFL